MTNEKLFSPFRLDGRRALVTGASSGFGHHFSLVLAQAGAEVVVAARRTDRLADLVKQIEAAGGRAKAVALDVTSGESVRACLAEAGPLHVVVNNAGTSVSKRILDYTEEDWDYVVGTNLRGAWLVAQEAAKVMAASQIRGSIVNITSILGSRVQPGLTAYATAKAGLKHLTRSMALEVAKYGIRVNSIAPGYVATEINGDYLRSADGEKLKARVPQRRFGELADFTGPLLLLASDAGAYMTGAELVVDGGHLCNTL